MNILLIGGGAAGLQTFKRILKAGHRVTAVLSSPPPYEFRGASLVGIAEKECIPVWSGTLAKEPQFADIIRSHHVDILLNVNSLYRICPEVLEAPQIGAFNFHPSRLPDYAGLNAPSWAVFHGEKSHGVTIHWMVPTIDAGEIAYQAEFPIENQDTCATISFKCVKFGVPLIDELLHTAETNVAGIPRKGQDLRKRRYYGAGPPHQGCIRWAAPARDIHNFLRSCEYRPFPSPWGYPRTKLGTQEIGVIAARRTGRVTNLIPGSIGQVTDAGGEVACSDEWLLVTELFANGSYLPAAKRLSPGMRLEDIVTAAICDEQ